MKKMKHFPGIQKNNDVFVKTSITCYFNKLVLVYEAKHTQKSSQTLMMFALPNRNSVQSYKILLLKPKLSCHLTQSTILLKIQY